MAFANTMQKCVALLLTVLVPLAVAATDWGGTITASSGVVSLNGQMIRGSHSIMAGDLVNTAKGRAIVRVAGGSVGMGEYSDVRFEKSTVFLTTGSAEIIANKEISTHYRDLTIRSVGAEEASFVVGELQRKPTVATLKGAILITDGSGSVVLPAGRAISSVAPDNEEPTAVAAGQDGQTAEPAAKGRHKTQPEEERGGQKNRKVLSGWWETAIIAGIVGGILVGIWAGGGFDRKPASNQSPGPIIVP